MNFYYLYNLAQIFLWPGWLIPLLSTKRRTLWRKRISSSLPSLSSPVIWVHALSVGELQAAKPLLKLLKKEFPQVSLVLSVTTTSGFLFAQKNFSSLVKEIIPSPVDLWPVVKKFVDKISPDIYIILETDIWPNILYELKKRGTFLMMVNASISQKAFQRLRKIPSLAKFLYNKIDILFTASLDDKQKLQTLLPNKKIYYKGNLKFDIDLPEVTKVKNLFKELGPYLFPPVIVCGSTHKGEEELLLKAFKNLNMGSLILCPRNPQRAYSIYKLSLKEGFSTCLRSSPKPCQVMVIDTLGELHALYALAEISFVGGTLVPVGGHNLLEPASLGVPVSFGPYCESIRNLSQEFVSKGAGIKLKNNYKDIAKKWEKMLSLKKQMGKASEAIFDQYQGVAQKIVQFLENIITFRSNYKKI